MKYNQFFSCFNKCSYKYQHWNPKHKECIFHTDQSIIKSFYHVSILSHKSSIHRTLKCFLKEIYSFHIKNSDYNSSRMKIKQMSETFLLAMIITFSGGLQDAYTYFARNKVFANAQTGNIVLMASKLSDGQYADAIRYVFPLLSFALGIFVAEQIQGYYKEAKKLHWRQTILILEIVSLFVSGFFNENGNLYANCLVSFSCAMQVQAFRSVHGYPYASTMCIGNMRAGVSAFSHWMRTKNEESLKKALHYIGIIITFALGATVGYSCILYLGMKTIWISSTLLLIGFLMMFIQNTERSR